MRAESPIPPPADPAGRVSGSPPAGPAARMAGWAMGAALLTVTLWSTNFPILRFALEVYTPAEAAFLRCGFAAAAMAVYAALFRMGLPARRDVPVFLFFGLTGMALSTLGLTYGLRTVSAGAGAFVIGMIPVFAALMARRFLGERLNPAGWGGIALSLGGVVVIGFGEAGARAVGTAPGDALPALNAGVLFLAGSALVQASFYVFQKPYLRRYTPGQVTAYVVWGGALCLGFAAPGAAARTVSVPWPYTAVLAFQGVLPVALAFVLWSFALARGKAAYVTSTVYLMPALSLLLAWAWLGEVPALLSVAGGLLALGGVAVLNLWGR